MTQWVKVYRLAHTPLSVHRSESLVDSRPLATLSLLGPTGLLSGTLLLRCHGDSAALELQDWPLHMLEQFTDGVDGGVGQLAVQILELVVARAGQSASSPPPSTPGRALPPCPPTSSLNAVPTARGGRLLKENPFQKRKRTFRREPFMVNRQKHSYVEIIYTPWT